MLPNEMFNQFNHVLKVGVQKLNETVESINELSEDPSKEEIDGINDSKKIVDKMNVSAKESSEKSVNAFDFGIQKINQAAEFIKGSIEVSSEKQSGEFIDSEKIVNKMKVSAKESSEKVVEKVLEFVNVVPFSDSSVNGNIEADLNIGIVDKNGFMDYGEKDLNISINGKVDVKKDVFFDSLKSLEGKAVKRSAKADVDIGRVKFDPKDKSYKIKLKIDGFLFMNDDIDLVIKPDKDNNLVMSVKDKWLPDWGWTGTSSNDILSEVNNKVAKELKNSNFGLDTKIKNGKLFFLPKVKNQSIKVDSKNYIRIDKTNIDQHNIKFDINKDGDIGINFKNVSITGSNIGKDKSGNLIKEKSSGDIDFANLDIKANINSKGDKEVSITDGRILTRIDSKEASRIKVEGSELGAHFENINLHVDGLKGKAIIDKNNQVETFFGGNIDLELDRPKRDIDFKGNIGAEFDSKGNFKVVSNDLTVNHMNGQNHIKNLLVLDDENGFQLHLDETEKPQPKSEFKTSNNYLKPIIGSKNYITQLHERIAKAKESINIEVFLYSGSVAENLTDSLLLKSAGLDIENGISKLKNKDGVKVKVLFDSSKGDKSEKDHKSYLMIKNKFNSLKDDIKNGKGKFNMLSDNEKQVAISNIDKNMDWKLLDGGLSRIDHRKVVIIDGQNSFSTGGVNLTGSVMKKHDIMTDIWGPVVGEIQKEFIDNWQGVGGNISDTEKDSLIKSEKQLKSIMKKQQRKDGSNKTTKSQLLFTDDNQFDIYQKLVSEIRSAKKEINIEHAYFSDSKIVEEVANSLKNGVSVNIVLPEYSDEGDKIHYGNLATLQDLHKASKVEGSGKLNAYLFKWDKKAKTGMFNHTKAMSFDGKKAIFGSANLTNRSLRGTLDGFLFNREIAMFVDDKSYVKDMNKDLFFNDMNPERALKLDDQWFKDLEKQQDKIDKYKALQPLF